MKQTYRAGIIGLGFIGGADQVSGDALGQQVKDLDGTHVAAFENNTRVEVVAGSSRDEGRRSRFHDRTGAVTYADWREMISEAKLDIVSVATYTPVHKEITLGCAAAGIPVVYCEKPIANSVSDGEAMVKACEDAGSLLVINHNRRFSRNFRRFRDLLREDGLGDLTSITLQWSAGRLGNIGTHVFDAVRMVTAREAIAVSGTLDLSGKPDCRGSQFSDPGGWGLIKFEDGIMATVDAPDYAAHGISMRFSGMSGMATINGRVVTLDYKDGRHEIWPVDTDRESSMDIAVGEIVDWLDTRKDFPCSAMESVRTLEVITAFHVSHRRNSAWVELPLAGADRDIVINSG